ncbi:MAG: DNA-directed RNA polymerase subunit alpha C-terminal domain-containing protein [Candidatus Promineifilaceae bacterium]
MRAEQEDEAEFQSPLNVSIEEVPLNTRSLKALQSSGITTVGAVLERLQQGEDALLAINGVGQKALIDIKKYLRAHGLIE